MSWQGMRWSLSSQTAISGGSIYEQRSRRYPLDAVMTPDEVGNLVGNLAGRRFLEHVSYLEDSDVLALQSGHFAALIERNFIDELKDVPRDKLKRLTVSA